MFDFVRNHTRLALGFMLLLIIPSFIFFGVQGYSRFIEPANDTVAKVDGLAIKRVEWDNAVKRSVDQLRRQSPNVDPARLDTPQLRQDTLEGMVRERLLQAAANELHLFPNGDRMARIFDSDPQYAGLRGPDGLISRELLAVQGMSPEMFDQRLRQELGLRQVLSGITQTAPTMTVSANLAIEAFLQRRAVQMQRFEAAAYRDQVKPSDAELEAYYKANEAQFKAPEQADIEYVTLDLSVLGQTVAAGEPELRKAYADAAARFTTPEERRSSHILIAADKDKPAAERAKAKARAEELLAELRKSPASFAELARKNSGDPGSAAKGGDLDFHPRGDMTPPFDDAVFKLKPGEMSGVVETDFGYHIITLTAVRGGQVRPFEEVRAELEAEVRKAGAQKRWAEAAEQFTNTAYEQSDSLQPLIDKLKVVKKTATVARTPAPGTSGPLASTKFLDAVFATDTVRNKRNTDAVEVGPNQLVAARVLKHQPARTLALGEVKDRVRERMVEQQATALARKAGEARLAALRANPGAEALPLSMAISRAQAQGTPKPLLDAVLQADPSKLPAVSGVDLGDQGYVVVRVMQLLPREAVPGGEGPMREQYAQAWAAAEAEAYVASLRKRYKAQVSASAEAASAPAR
jgi:peptidyl-prolyl cis-trans isomerase D